jgi:hypothetical protein
MSRLERRVCVYRCDPVCGADEIPVVYYTEGHGEGDMNTDYSGLKSSMELHGYELRSLNLTAVEKVPKTLR